MFVTNIDEGTLLFEYKLFLLKFAEMTLGKKETLDYFSNMDPITLEGYAQAIRVNDTKSTAFYMGMAFAYYSVDARARGVELGVFDWMKYKLRKAFDYKL